MADLCSRASTSRLLRRAGCVTFNIQVFTYLALALASALIVLRM